MYKSDFYCNRHYTCCTLTWILEVILVCSWLKLIYLDFSGPLKLFSDFIISQYNCVYRPKEKPHVTAEEAVNFPWITLNCNVSSRRIVEIVTSTSCRTSICHILTWMAMKKYYFQQDGALSHYHRKERDFLNAHLYVRWLADRRSAEVYANGIFYEITLHCDYIFETYINFQC